MRVTEVDHRLAALAAGQHGVFSRAQAFEAGASERLISRRLAEGEWSRIDRGVYAVRGHRGTWLRQLKAAELGTPGAAVAARSAAVLQELTGFRPGRPEIAVPLTTTSRSRIAIVHRYAGAQVTTVRGFRCTTVTQTLFDLAALRTQPWTVERAMDDAVAAGRLAVDELEELLRSYGGTRRHGLVLMRALVSERSEDGWAPPESELERKASEVLHKACGGWVRQHRLPFRGPVAGRVDFALPAARLIVEADGRRWHTRVADFDRDRWRDNEAIAAGWRVLRFTWVHLTATPEDVVTLLRRALARATR